MALYVVATPIGNIEDITLRALRILREADIVAAEDTRKTARLLTRHGITARLISYHEHNERRSSERIINLLKEGSDVALVTNAGTPLLSDPGYVLVGRAIEEGIDVIPVPGPSAPAAAMSVSGLPTHETHFLGFPPRKSKALETALARAAQLHGTLIYFQSPVRLEGFLRTAAEILGDRRAVVAREITKLHEEIARGTLTGLTERFSTKTVKGEVVVLIAGSG